MNSSARSFQTLLLGAALLTGLLVWDLLTELTLLDLASRLTLLGGGLAILAAIGLPSMAATLASAWFTAL